MTEITEFVSVDRELQGDIEAAVEEDELPTEETVRTLVQSVMDLNYRGDAEIETRSADGDALVTGVGQYIDKNMEQSPLEYTISVDETNGSRIDTVQVTVNL